MNILSISPTEKANKRLNPEHLAEAVSLVQQDGYIILQDCVERTHAELLCEKMLSDTEVILKRDDVPFNFNAGNIQQDPPPFPPYLFDDVLLNPFVIAITQSILGSGLKSGKGLASGNSPEPKG